MIYRRVPRRSKIRQVKARHDTQQRKTALRGHFVLARILSTALLVASPFAFAAERHTATVKRLPQPTGQYAVGRITYHWIDHSRTEQFSKLPGASRELMVYIWYPADSRGHSKRSRYLPGVDAFAGAKNGKQMRDFWGDSWPLARSHRVVSETLDAPPVAPGNKRFPLLTFSPGLGIPVIAYTALIQEVVSHGYVVASIEPTYEAPVVVFPDGRMIPASPEATGRHLPTPAGETREQFIKRMHSFDEPHINRWAADITFSIDQMRLLNSGNPSVAPFAGRLDLRNVAAWGHSFGGRAAARACQLDQRIKACMNADGLGPDGPIFVFQGEPLPSQPFMWMEVHHEPPTDAQLAPYGMTRKEWERDHEVQLATDEKQLHACAGGSVHVLVNTSGISHLSFTDEPFVGATTELRTNQASLAIRTIGVYTVGFFDRELEHRRGTVLDEQNAQSSAVSIQVVPPPR